MSGRVIVEAGRLPWAVDQVEQNILKNYAEWGLFQCSDRLVRAVTATLEDNKRQHVARPDGATILAPASTPMLEDIFARAMTFAKYNKDGELYPINCPTKIASIYLSRAGLWKLPQLTGIVTAPVTRPDGSLLTTPGYDEDTGLLLRSAVSWLAHLSLARQAVPAAVKTLLAPFSQFNLRAEAERSVIISAILSGLQRRLLYSVPAHALNAPVQSSGKSLLADAIAIIVTGHPVVSTSVNADEDELRKKLVSILLAGDAAVSLDNITRPLSNATLSRRS